MDSEDNWILKKGENNKKGGIERKRGKKKD